MVVEERGDGVHCIKPQLRATEPTIHSTQLIGLHPKAIFNSIIPTSGILCALNRCFTQFLAWRVRHVREPVSIRSGGAGRHDKRATATKVKVSRAPGPGFKNYRINSS